MIPARSVADVTVNLHGMWMLQAMLDIATVAPELREKVQHAVDELGYVPNQAARSLMTQRTDSIAPLAAPVADLFTRSGSLVRLPLTEPASS